MNKSASEFSSQELVSKSPMSANDKEVNGFLAVKKRDSSLPLDDILSIKERELEPTSMQDDSVSYKSQTEVAMPRANSHAQEVKFYGR